MAGKRKDLIVNFAVGALVVTFCYFNPADPESGIIQKLADGLFSAGALMLGAGVILFCSSKGAFNLFGYSAKFGLSLILPIGKNPWIGDKDRESYYDYCVRKAEEVEKKPKPFAAILIVGAVYMALSLAFLPFY